MIPEYKRFPIVGLLTRPRQTDSGWLVLQAESLCRFAKENNSSTALVYSALECRNAIEETMFLIIQLAKGSMDNSTYVECRKKDGLLRVLEQYQPQYSQLVRFMKIMLSMDPNAPTIAEWDIKVLKRFHSSVSQFCHFQGIKQKTIESTMGEWLARGIVLVESVLKYFFTNLQTGGTALIPINEAPPEVRQAWEEFASGKLKPADLKVRLELMRPVLARRKLMVPGKSQWSKREIRFTD